MAIDGGKVTPAVAIPSRSVEFPERQGYVGGTRKQDLAVKLVCRVEVRAVVDLQNFQAKLQWREAQARITIYRSGTWPETHHFTLTCNNSMGLKCLLATVGITFVLSVSSVVAEPATLPFTDCFSGDVSHKVQVSTVYGQELSGRYLNFTIIGSTPIQIVSASNNTDEPVASACHLNSFNVSGCDVADLVNCFPSDPFHDHQPTHVQRMG